MRIVGKKYNFIDLYNVATDRNFGPVEVQSFLHGGFGHTEEELRELFMDFMDPRLNFSFDKARACEEGKVTHLYVETESFKTTIHLDFDNANRFRLISESDAFVHAVMNYLFEQSK